MGETSIHAVVGESDDRRLDEEVQVYFMWGNVTLYSVQGNTVGCYSGRMAGSIIMKVGERESHL